MTYIYLPMLNRVFSCETTKKKKKKKKNDRELLLEIKKQTKWVYNS